MNKKNEIYENAPLVEVVFEIRFPGEPAIECNRDRFYEKIRNIYSHVLVPTPKQFEDRAAVLDSYKFQREDGTGGVMLSINKMAVYFNKYEGFNLFKKEAMRLFSVFGELFKVKKLNRAGLRYINFIPLIREKNIIPISNYLNIHISLPTSIPADFTNLNLRFVSQTEGGSITTHIEPIVSQDQTKEAIILDFDYAKEEELNFDLIEKYLDESHRHTKHFFEELITDDYRKFMRGEVI